MTQSTFAPTIKRGARIIDQRRAVTLKLAILGNHLPRQCGIATYTSDLASHLSSVRPDIDVKVVAMNDKLGYRYGNSVAHSILEGNREAYRKMAHRLNEERFDVLNVQHEFGIYGGEAGEYLLDLVRAAKMPIVTTAHTLLQRPTAAQRRVFDELLQRSDRVITMTQKGVDILSETYHVDPEKIDCIQHGIPDADLEGGRVLREQLGLGSRPLLLTFGLLSKDKGIDVAIDAMAEVVQAFPEALYAVVGVTHPNVRQAEGERYRTELEEKTKVLGLENNVRLINRFVSNEELACWLAASDVYITPYLKAEQITSGTLAFALGTGNAVVSTPFWHAEELLADGRGILVPFRDAAAMADSIGNFLGHDDMRNAMCQKAKEFGLQMRWPEVARQHSKSFERARSESQARVRVATPAVRVESIIGAFPLPKASLEHLRALTDDTGLFQHARYRVPNREEGYCIDDNARALLVTARTEGTAQDRETLRELRSRYLSFVDHAFDRSTKRFRNFMSYRREWLEDIGSEDSNARTLYALAYAASRMSEADDCQLARDLLNDAHGMLEEMGSPRAWAFGVLACDEALRHESSRSMLALRDELVHRLFKIYRTVAHDRWWWFEDRLSYDNARLSQALIVGGASEHPKMVEAGLQSLKWLMTEQTGHRGEFAPIGCLRGFWAEGDPRPWFDQQPIEAWASIGACLAASRATGQQTEWQAEARRAFAWFHGENMARLPLADPQHGWCRDGLQDGGVNRNCGAESTISYLMSITELRESESAKPGLGAIMELPKF